MLLFFALGGFEGATVPSEEVIHPRRMVPVALISGVTLVVVLYLLIQVVAIRAPFRNWARTRAAGGGSFLLSPVGGLLLTVGAIVSTTGTDGSSI